MNNPFTTSTSSDKEDTELVARANHGDRRALEELILRHQAWVYNIAVRMVFNTHDAEEVTQEVLVKVITKLSTFKGQSAFRTWLYRIVANHVLNMKQRAAESRSLTFTQLGTAIDRTPELELPDPRTVPVDVPMLVEEAKIACAMGILLCLDRQQRLIFTLGEIFGVADTVGGDVLEMTADNFRQCLARARRDLHNFLNNQCGLVNTANPCRCAKKTRGFVEQGQVDPNRLMFAAQHVERVREVAPAAVHQIEDAVEARHAALYRDHPFLRPADQAAWLRRLLDSDPVRMALRLG